KEEAKRMIADANQLIENTIREIRENKAEKEATKTLRTQLQEFSAKKLKQEPVVETPDSSSAPVELENGTITEGSFVRLKGQTAMGQVLAVRGREADVRIGALKSTIKLNRLEKISAKTYKNATQESLTENS